MKPEKERGYSQVDSVLDADPTAGMPREIYDMLRAQGVEMRDASFFSTFAPVLPEGTKSLREYFDSTLPEDASFVEYGGPGRGIRLGFTVGRIKKSVGVTLDNAGGTDIEGHTVITGDMRSPDTDERVAEALDHEQPDAILERMLRGLDVAKFSEEEFIGFLNKWHRQARHIILVQVPVDLNDAVQKWADELKKSFGSKREVVFFAGESNRSHIVPHSALLVRKIA